MWGLTGFKLYAIAGLGLALLISLGANRYQHGKVESLRTDLATAQASLASTVSANESQSAAIDQCLQSNAQWLSLGKGVKELAASLKELDEAKAERAVLQAKLNERWKHVSAQCQTWMDGDFTALCPDVDSSVRDYAKDR